MFNSNGAESWGVVKRMSGLCWRVAFFNLSVFVLFTGYIVERYLRHVLVVHLSYVGVCVSGEKAMIGSGCFSWRILWTIAFQTRPPHTSRDFLKSGAAALASENHLVCVDAVRRDKSCGEGSTLRHGRIEGPEWAPRRNFHQPANGTREAYLTILWIQFEPQRCSSWQ